jgi:hypothetical protein
VLCVLAVRRAYLGRLLPGARLGPVALRAAVPVGVATALVLAVRLALWGGERPLGQALGELALWLATLVAATVWLERDLLGELRGYLRGRVERPPPEPAPAAS